MLQVKMLNWSNWEYTDIIEWCMLLPTQTSVCPLPPAIANMDGCKCVSPDFIVWTYKVDFHTMPPHLGQVDQLPSPQRMDLYCIISGTTLIEYCTVQTSAWSITRGDIQQPDRVTKIDILVWTSVPRRISSTTKDINLNADPDSKITLKPIYLCL